jgi:hypothetical protein
MGRRASNARDVDLSAEKGNRFANFEQRKWDFAGIEATERTLLEQAAKDYQKN